MRESRYITGLAPDQIVSVAVQFGAQKAGELIQGAALDGGMLSIPAGGLTADANGNISFTFQAGHDPGLLPGSSPRCVP